MMQMRNVTTPFGRRPMTLALVRRQTDMDEIKAGKTADKFKVFRDVSAAMDLLGMQSNSLAVLDALLSFYPGNELRHGAQLIVFPSNAQLCLRAHAMAGATLRRHLALLVEKGLIVRKDSANGKRYARRDGKGDIEAAYGFDLSPLLARAEEFAHLAQQVFADRAALRQAKESLTICRRDVRKLITAAMEEGADGDWQRVEAIYVGLVARIPRAPTLMTTVGLLEEMRMLRDEVVNRLKTHTILDKDSTSDTHTEQHIQNSETESYIEFEPGSRRVQGEMSKASRDPSRLPPKSLPLGMVLKACPQIIDYGPSGTISNWRDLMSAAVVVRSMLDISPSAYRDACDVLGPDNAAVTMACILERANMITSAGGYLRDLTRRARRGEFSLWPMIMALLKVHGAGLIAGGMVVGRSQLT